MSRRLSIGPMCPKSYVSYVTYVTHAIVQYYYTPSNSMTNLAEKIFLLSMTALLATGCAPQATTPTRVPARTLSPTKKIVLGNTVLSVQVAATPNEQQQGLSGIENIQANEGMVFTYSPPSRPTFWMKDMLFPIDIIWIRDGNVIGISKDVQPADTRQVDTTLAQYPSPGNVTAVLEVQAGWTTTHAIHPGSVVTGL